MTATPAFGVQAHYIDAFGRRRACNPDTRRLLRQALGDSRDFTSHGEQPVRPKTCYLPAEERLWGFAAQLYAVRSRSSWGIGDLADLGRLGRWARGLGAGFVLLNPLHAALPVGPQQASPYYPSSRRFRNPLYIAVDRVAGHRAAARELAPLATRARKLNRDRLIHRDDVQALKMPALEALWKLQPASAAFERFRDAGGTALDDFCLYCALAERHGADWRRWPAALRKPSGRGLARARVELASRVDFHAWLQWLADEQLAAAARELPPLNDLAVGADPAGADAWAWQDLLLPGFTVGAPPDALGPGGQDWGFPAFSPRALLESGFAPWRELLRASLDHALGARIDHVMGLFRLWLIPTGAPATEGAYVTYPARPVLDLIAEESRRAGALIVGEDLGTVQPEVRDELRRRRVLSYRLLLFEPRPPRRYPHLSLAATTTHDLPTLAGLWAANRAGAGEEAPDSTFALADRLRRLARVSRGASAEDLVTGAYRRLAGAPSRLRAATLEDALLIAEQPNKPGTVNEWPNWSLALPGGLEGLTRSGTARRLAEILSGSER